MKTKQMSLKRALEAADMIVLDCKAKSALIAAALLKLNNLQMGVFSYTQRCPEWENPGSQPPQPGPSRRAIVVGFEGVDHDYLSMLAQDFKKRNFEPIAFFSDGDRELFVRAFRSEFAIRNWVPLPAPKDSGDNAALRLLKSLMDERLDDKDNYCAALLNAANEEGLTSVYPQLALFEQCGWADQVGRAVHHIARNRWNHQGNAKSDPEEAMAARVAQMLVSGKYHYMASGGGVLVVEEDSAARAWSCNAAMDAAFFQGWTAREKAVLILKRGLCYPDELEEEQKKDISSSNPLAKFGYKPENGSKTPPPKEVPCWRIYYPTFSKKDEKVQQLMAALAANKIRLARNPELSSDGVRVLDDPDLETLLKAFKEARL